MVALVAEALEVVEVEEEAAAKIYFQNLHYYNLNFMMPINHF